MDNEDAGFYIPKKRELWFRDLFGKEEKNINDIYDYEPVADGKEGWRVYVNENAMVLLFEVLYINWSVRENRLYLGILRS